MQTENYLQYDFETIDDLIINNYKIIQSEKGFKFSIDAVLLAHFASIKKNTRVIDLGTGTGVIALLAKALGAAEVVGIEIDNYMAKMAARSVKLNNLETKIKILNLDFRQLKGQMPAGYYDIVLSNPPYRPVGQGKLNQSESISKAKHELATKLEDVVAAAQYLVKYRGRAAFIHRADRLSEIICIMVQHKLEPKRMRLVQSYANAKPKLVLIEGIKGAAPGIDILAPLIIYNNDGTYTDEILKYYAGGTNE